MKHYIRTNNLKFLIYCIVVTGISYLRCFIGWRRSWDWYIAGPFIYQYQQHQQHQQKGLQKPENTSASMESFFDSSLLLFFAHIHIKEQFSRRCYLWAFSIVCGKECQAVKAHNKIFKANNDFLHDTCRILSKSIQFSTRCSQQVPSVAKYFEKLSETCGWITWLFCCCPAND